LSEPQAPSRTVLASSATAASDNGLLIILSTHIQES
jgi:hypothetical protein